MSCISTISRPLPNSNHVSHVPPQMLTMSRLASHVLFGLMIPRLPQMLTMSRLASHVLFGLMIGSLYLGIGNEAKSAYNNAAQLFFAVMFLLFGALMSTILTCESPRGRRKGRVIVRMVFCTVWYSGYLVH